MPSWVFENLMNICRAKGLTINLNSIQAKSLLNSSPADWRKWGVDKVVL